MNTLIRPALLGVGYDHSRYMRRCIIKMCSLGMVKNIYLFFFFFFLVFQLQYAYGKMSSPLFVPSLYELREIRISQLLRSNRIHFQECTWQVSVWIHHLYLEFFSHNSSHENVNIQTKKKNIAGTCLLGDVGYNVVFILNTRNPPYLS